MDHLPRHGDLGGHVGQAEGHRLVLDDRLAEGHPLVGIVARRLERRASHAHRLGGDADAPALEVAQGDAVALALLAQAQAGRDAQLIELDLAGVRGVLAELVLDPHHRVPRCVSGHDKGADALLAGCRIGHGEDDHHPGVAARGDELLAAIEHIVFAVAPGAAAQVTGIRTGLGFGEGEGAEHPALGQRAEEALLLLIAAVFQDRHAAHRVVHAHDGRAGAVAGGDFLQGHGVAQVAGLRAAPVFRHQHAHEPQLAHLGDGLGRETVLAVPLGGKGLQPFPGELAGHVADLHVLL
ncbi:hypothetical protein D3C85_873480 [compost metagenome]